MAKSHLAIQFSRGSFWLVEVGEYPRSSVLAGQYRCQKIEPFDTLEGAQAEHPGVPYEGGSVPSSWLPGVSDVAPADFDPADAGERWEEDY